MRQENGQVFAEKGDSLASIAHALGIDFTALCAANKTALVVGSPIKIPAGAVAKTDAPPNGDDVSSELEGEVVVRVTPEQVQELIGEIELVHATITHLQESETELRKMIADALEESQRNQQLAAQALAALEARIVTIEGHPPDTSAKPNDTI